MNEVFFFLFSLLSECGLQAVKRSLVFSLGPTFVTNTCSVLAAAINLHEILLA
jgi:hypothetical protein